MPDIECQTAIQVVAGVVHCESKILLARRAPGKHLAGYWEFPGGKIEAGETMGQTLERELVEEFSFNVEAGEYIGSQTFHYSDRTIHLHACHAQAAQQCGPGDSHDQVVWISPEDLTKYSIAPADAFIVEYLLQRLPAKNRQEPQSSQTKVHK